MATKEITKERLESIKSKLKVAGKPIKQKYSKKEALNEMLAEIRRLRKKKLTFAEIAQVISECSEGEIKLKASQIGELFTAEDALKKSKAEREKIRWKFDTEIQRKESERSKNNKDGEVDKTENHL